MAIDPGNLRSATDLHTAPLSTPVKTAPTESRFQRFVQWIKSWFATKQPVLPHLSHQAQSAAIEQPEVHTLLSERPQQAVLTQAASSPTLAAATLSKAIEVSIQDGVNFMDAKAKQGIQTETPSRLSDNTDIASTTVTETNDESSLASLNSAEKSATQTTGHAEHTDLTASLPPEESAAQATVQAEHTPTPLSAPP